jgi:tetratricopeptide (TPR) repeat protein
MSFGPQAAMRWDAGLGFLLDAGVALSYTIQGREGSIAGSGQKDGPSRATTGTTKKAAASASRIVFDGEPSLETIFPVFFKYYEDHSLGSIRIKNTGSTTLSDIHVSFHLKQYMDGPSEKKSEITIPPGETGMIPVYALLNDSILDVTESTKTQVELVVRAKAGAAQTEASISASIRVADRNAMTWIDDKAAAAFITAKDPAVLTFAKGTIGSTKSAVNPSLNRNFTNSMAIHEALCEAGIEYVTDPKSSYGQAAKGSAIIDFLLFPRQTLEYRAGDCDDLSILYCALLEAIGVETAFITVPGHIYIAAALGISQDESRAAFRKTDNLIFHDGAAWIPIEVTERKGGFLSAWEEGAKQWREAKSRDQAGFFPIHEAWSTFEPVGLPGTANIPMPEMAKVSARLASESVRFVEKEIADNVARLQAQLRTAQDESKIRNELGVLYARYGLTDRAAQEFGKAIAKKEYLGALVNLGHLSYMEKELEKALALYERAFKVQSKSALVLLSLARVSHDMENYGAVKKYYTELKSLDPAMAERFSYLELRGDDGARAAEISGARGVMVWSK